MSEHDEGGHWRVGDPIGWIVATREQTTCPRCGATVLRHQTMDGTVTRSDGSPVLTEVGEGGFCYLKDPLPDAPLIGFVHHGTSIFYGRYAPAPEDPQAKVGSYYGWREHVCAEESKDA